MSHTLIADHPWVDMQPVTVSKTIPETDNQAHMIATVITNEGKNPTSLIETLRHIGAYALPQHIVDMSVVPDVISP